MNMIGVKNTTKETVIGRYNGNDFEFKPAVTVALSEDAAAHIFGYGNDNKTNALLRLGWLANSTTYAEAVKRLEGFKFLSQARVEFTEPTDIKSGAVVETQQDIPVFTSKSAK